MGLTNGLCMLSAATAVLVLFLAGCEEPEPRNPYTGNMSDHTWGNQVTPEQVKARVNALGREVVISEFKNGEKADWMWFSEGMPEAPL